MSTKVNRHPKIVGKIGDVDDKEVVYKFILVINGHRKDWLMPVKDALNFKMKAHNHIWKSEVVVLNEIGAQAEHLIIRDEPSNTRV